MDVTTDDREAGGAGYLQNSDVINILDEDVRACAASLLHHRSDHGEVETARACFEFVRDRIRHSVDHRCGPVTCRASDALKHETGYCYAKSHLLAALLRANGIPAGFCYQRLAVGEVGPPFCLHAYNAVYLREFGWYRVDARGNRQGVDAQFAPPVERLAFSTLQRGEVEFEEIFAEPLPLVVEALRRHERWDDMLLGLPDVVPEKFSELGLSVRRVT